MKETHMPASSIYSKQVNQKRIHKLKELFTTFRVNKEEKLKKVSQKKKLKEARI
jgi:LysM repeat protein